MSHSPALRFARGGVIASLLLGCGEDPAAQPPPAPLDAGLGTGISPIVDAAPPPLFPVLDAAPAAPGGGAVVPPGPEAGSIMLGGVDASTMPMMPAPDAGADAGPIVITIPTRTVTCGSTECTTTNNRTCCNAWTINTGFDSTASCTTQAACEADHLPYGDTNRAVINDCDEPGDCGAGHVCCFVRYGMPIIDIFGTGEQVGPGASRMCIDLSACNAGMMSFSGVLGVPIGLTACRKASDCTDGTTCMPEQAGSSTAGKGGAARPGVMVCR